MTELSVGFHRFFRALLLLSFFFSVAAHADKSNDLWRDFTIGRTRLVALYDGPAGITRELLQGAPASVIDALFKASKSKPAINAFVVIVGSETILIDSGMGVSNKGKALNALKSAGFKPEQISAIFLTHLHYDHVGGLMVDGKPLFPNASVYVDSRELAYWNDDESIPAPDQKPMFDMARAFQSAYRVVPVQPGQALFDGVTVVDEVGHTPGHVGYLFDCGAKKLLVWGDVIHQIDVQLADPGIYLTFDVDPEKAIATRKTLLEWVAGEKIVVAGMHLPFPGVVEIRKAKDGGYRYHAYRPAADKKSR